MDIETCKGEDGHELPYLVCLLEYNGKCHNFWGIDCID